MAKHQHTSPENTGPVTEGRTIHWATRYDLFVSLVMLGRAAAFRRRTADLAHLQAGEAVLDVGCGTGDLTFAVEKQVGPNGKIVGIDAAPEMITRARQKATRLGSAVDFRVEPVEVMSFADHTFDVVICSLAFHHFPLSKSKRWRRYAGCSNQGEECSLSMLCVPIITTVSFRKPLCFNQGRNEGSRRRKPYGGYPCEKRFSFPAGFSRKGASLSSVRAWKPYRSAFCYTKNNRTKALSTRGEQQFVH